jgi:hypothetical protein
VTEQVLSTGPVEEATVVYTTKTGDEPRGGPSLTKEATEPVPEPTRLIRKTATKKAKPRVRAKTEPLHTEVKVDPRVMMAVRRVIAQGTYTRPQIIDKETVIIR